MVNFYNGAGKLATGSGGPGLQMSNGSSMGFGTANTADPLYPKGGAKGVVRVCDWYAWKLSWLDGAPWFEMYWPQAKRDQVCKDMAAFIRLRGDRFRYSAIQQTVADFDVIGDDAKMAFPKLSAPATAQQVAAGTAIFWLEGGKTVRVVELNPWPAKAKWTTLKQFPITLQGETDAKGVTHYSTVYQNEGLIWQAEEVQHDGRWERYYGFAGPHIVAKVPAGEIELMKDPQP